MSSGTDTDRPHNHYHICWYLALYIVTRCIVNCGTERLGKFGIHFFLSLPAVNVHLTVTAASDLLLH